jgi:lipopolysaccharide transport system permease protein
MLRALWEYRGFISSLVRREFRIQSVRAVWGNAWLVIQPAAQILIYTVIFAEVLGAKLTGIDDPMAYGLYLCAGLLTWNYFSEIVTRCQTLFLDHAILLKTIRFPRSTLPAALFVTATVNFAIVAGIFLLVLAALGRWPGWVLLAAAPLLLAQVILGLGIGILTGALNVFYRDVGRIVGIVMQFWFWLTPIVYPSAIVPERFRGWFDWNPMFHLVSGYQQIVVTHSLPDWGVLFPLYALAAATAAASWGAFRALSPDLVEEL